MKKLLSILLAITMIFSTVAVAASAVDEETVATDEQIASLTETVTDATVDALGDVISATATCFKGLKAITSFEDFEDNFMKVLYNGLSVLTELLVKTIVTVYPDPAGWGNLSDKVNENFLAGHATYQTSAKPGNYWTLGYASESLVPEDIDCGEYYLGRDLLVKKAQGCYDDMKIRVTVIDDNSGEGAVVFGAIDCLGVTNTDVCSIREEVLKYCKEKNINVASINIGATHCHSALDTQGVSTEFFYKLFGNAVNNALNIFDELPFLDYATFFKNYFIKQSIKAVEEAFEDATAGTLSYGKIDCNSFIKDKRGLVSQEDLPDTVTLKFDPYDNSESTYISCVTCHPTSFSANNGYVSSDYTYYLDKYIKEQTGSNFLLVQGALGQVSREIDIDYSKYTDEYDRMKAQAETLGNTFGEYIIKTDYSTKLDPILNVKSEEIFIVPTNSILALACKIKLVNNKVYYDDNGKCGIVSEIGYLEFGNKLGFAMFPGELYPEVFWGSEVINGTNWDGTEWPYESLYNSVDGVEVFPISLMNDATGYVLTDNNFAFMGHIIGDGIADEVLSVGKNEGSFLVSSYLSLVEDYTK